MKLAIYLVGVLVMLLWTMQRGIPALDQIFKSDDGGPLSPVVFWSGSIGIVFGIVIHSAAWPLTLPLRIYRRTLGKADEQ